MAAPREVIDHVYELYGQTNKGIRIAEEAICNAQLL